MIKTRKPFRLCPLLILLSLLKVTNGTEASIPVQGSPGQVQDQGGPPDAESSSGPPCGLWMAESALVRDQWSLFTGVDLGEGQKFDDFRDPLLPMFDANRNEWSAWHSLAWNGNIQPDLYLQNYFQLQTMTPGMLSLLQCSKELANVSPFASDNDSDNDSVGVHRSKDATAGSFAYRKTPLFQATTNLKAGRELFMDCEPLLDESEQGATVPIQFSEYIKQAMQRPIPMLQDEGICLDELFIGPSTLPHVGKGAFAKRHVRKGESIATSPVIVLDRSQVEIPYQYHNKHFAVIYGEEVIHQNLLLNYAIGHPNSTVLLFPYAPGVNYINHHNEKPNAVLDWSRSQFHDPELVSGWTSHEILEESLPLLAIDYIALRDIEPGEEIFLDYGREWRHAWDAHVQQWTPPKDSETYQSAADYRKAHPQEEIRTIDEQKEEPYPNNILTACFYKDLSKNGDDEEDDDDAHDDKDERVFWRQQNMGCLRPCTVHKRYDRNREVYYDVTVQQMTNSMPPIACMLSAKNQRVFRVPSRAIQLADREYTVDEQLSTTFRHEIGVRSGMYPQSWMVVDDNPMGDFILEPLAPGQIEPIRWKVDGSPVCADGYVMGLYPSVREVLMKYCDRMGITEVFRHLTSRGNGLAQGTNEFVNLRGQQWFVQRPDPHWKSNMHWVSPSDAESQEHYLKALSAGGFDKILQHVGEKFGMDGLAAYHVTFIGVSHCNEGYLHYDVEKTGSKVFNIIIPLLLAEETGPELDLRSDWSRSSGDVGRYRYQYDVASMMGDGCYHASSATDYRLSKEVRIAATVYVADINQGNVDSILKDYTQYYPPKSRPDILLSMAGSHWKKDDPSVTLPKPSEEWLEILWATE